MKPKLQIPPTEDIRSGAGGYYLGRRYFLLGTIATSAALSAIFSRNRVLDFISRYYDSGQGAARNDTAQPTQDAQSSISLEKVLGEGDTYLNRKDYYKALGSYKTALALKPNEYQSARADFGIGKAYFGMGSSLDKYYKTAVLHFDNVINLPAGEDFKRDALYLSALVLVNHIDPDSDDLKEVEERLTKVINYNIKDEMMQHALYLAGKINLDNDGIYNGKSECHERMPNFSLEVAQKHFKRLLREFPQGAYIKDTRTYLGLVNDLIKSKKCK